MQKAFVPDFLTGRKEKNRGQLEMHLVENVHEPIIDRETFDRVQEMARQTSGRNGVNIVI